MNINAKSDKYVKKIYHFLNSLGQKQLPNTDYNGGNCVYKTTVLNTIYNCANDSSKKNYDIKIKRTLKLKKIHENDDYPLIFILFKNMYLSGLFPMLPDITDITIFINWYRENIYKINFDEMHYIINNNNNNNIDELKEAYDAIYNPDINRKRLHDLLYDNKFISIDIQHDIETNNLNYIEYIIDSIHKVDIFYPNNVNPPDILIIAKIINMMQCLSLNININSTNKNDNLKENNLCVNLCVIYSNQKKIINKDTKILCCDNINSGSTYPGKIIVCWRREEFYKVLIHELIHYHKFDFCISDPEYNKIYSMIILPKVNGIDMVNECYTEACAIIILIILRYIENNISDNFDDYFKKSITYEVTFLMFQIGKVFMILGAETFNDYVNGNIILSQHTSFRSYFIIKMLLLIYINEFIKFMQDTLIVNGHKILLFGELINVLWTDMIHNTEYINIINRYINLLREKNDTKHKWIYKTCRMCANDTISSDI